MSTSYIVTVHGKSYEVVVEPKKAAPEEGPEKSPAMPAAAAAPLEEEAGSLIAAPMGGMVVAIKVCEGAQVKKGQEVMVLETVKTHHVLTAPADGLVRAVLVKTGNKVWHRQPLVLIR